MGTQVPLVGNRNFQQGERELLLAVILVSRKGKRSEREWKRKLQGGNKNYIINLRQYSVSSNRWPVYIFLLIQ